MIYNFVFMGGTICLMYAAHILRYTKKKINAVIVRSCPPHIHYRTCLVGSHQFHKLLLLYFHYYAYV